MFGVKILKKRKWRRSVLALLLLIQIPLFSAAAESPTRSFTYDLENNAVPAPDAAEFYINITGEHLGTGAFTEPTDVCCDSDGNIYIVDKGNSRIVKTDPDCRTAEVIKEFENGGKTDTFSQPEGVFVTGEGDIYICDTGNRRIVELAADFSFKRIIPAPDAAALGEDFAFTPVRITVDSLGRMYIVSRNFNSGIIELDKKGAFNQIFGAVEVEFTLSDIFWRMISTKAQKERSVSLVPNEYSSVCVDEKNFIYACSAYFDSTDSLSSVKKLNALGKNILDEISTLNVNRYSKGKYGGPETYVDVCSLGNGIYALLDNTRGRVFVYNDDGDMLFEFGGKGSYAGTFETVSALDYHYGRFYVADSRGDFVSVFNLTDYAMKYIQAAEYHSAGDYESENGIWKEIYALNNNSICTIRNFGRVNYREGNYKEAMHYFKLANDRESYSKAYSAQRRIFTGEHFSLIFTGAIFAVLALIAIAAVNKRRPKKERDPFTYSSALRYSLKIISRPISSFWNMKKEGYGRTSAALTILAAATLFFAVFNCTRGFIFTTGIGTDSFVMSLFTVIAPFFLFVICNWCVSSLMSGEGSFKYIFMGTAYSLTPMLIFLPVLLICSHIMTADEKSIYILLMSVMLIWTFALIVCSNMQVHSYTMSKTVLVLLITLLIMVIVVFLVMLVFALVSQMIGVGSDMANEIYLRF